MPILRTFASPPKISDKKIGGPSEPSQGLFTWGNNAQGQLGLSNTTNYSSPKLVGKLTTWTAVSVSPSGGTQFFVGIRSDTTMWSWGNNGSGRLGDGTTTDRSSPVQITGTSWGEVTPGGQFCAARKTTGTMWTWGRNQYGQLGTNNLSYYQTPTQVGVSTSWSGVYGFYATVIGRIGTALWGWGRNYRGELGLGNTTNYSSPKQIPGSWVSVVNNKGARSSAGAFKSGNALYVWGRNVYGQLGLGNTTNTSSPQQLAGSWSSAAMANGHTLGIRTDGSLWAWGRNNSGQLGLGNTTYYSSPKQVGSGLNWAAVSCGPSGGSMAVKTDGTMWVWGAGGGQLGLGNTTTYSSPVQLGNKSNWFASNRWFSMGSDGAAGIRT